LPLAPSAAMYSFSGFMDFILSNTALVVSGLLKIKNKMGVCNTANIFHKCSNSNVYKTENNLNGKSHAL
jgi:hypothetical protein